MKFFCEHIHAYSSQTEIKLLAVISADSGINALHLEYFVYNMSPLYVSLNSLRETYCLLGSAPTMDLRSSSDRFSMRQLRDERVCVSENYSEFPPDHDVSCGGRA